MRKKLFEILWYHDSHFIKREESNLDIPKKLDPNPIGEPFQLTIYTEIKLEGSTLEENRENTLNEFVSEKFPNANAYSQAVISMDGSYDRVYQLYRI
jgi:hypothetical protein